jgi:hypothetical protein
MSFLGRSFHQEKIRLIVKNALQAVWGGYLCSCSKFLIEINEVAHENAQKTPTTFLSR